ncbi:hypothetical protein LLG46_11940 [bacterium]|nr:hypothetical protein [bacterium]
MINGMLLFHRGLVVLFLSAWTMMAGLAAASTVPSQFGTLGPLPGDGFAVDSEGKLDGFGALQINIPIAYTPLTGYVVASGSAGGVTEDKSNFKNGTAVVGGSVGGWPRLWMSAMVIKNDNAVANGQLSVFSETLSRPAVAVGLQGLFRNSEVKKWGYITATKGFALRNNKNIYATVGIRGERKNARGIGGLSYPLSQSFNFATEWDGYQFNNGIAWRPGGQRGNVTLFGTYNSQTGLQAGASIYHNFAK